MIFGEYLGEVVSNGEYEVRAQGTTPASLKTAIDALTDEEYFDSFISVVTNVSPFNGDPMMLLPIYEDNTRSYERTIGWNSSTVILATCFYNDSGYVGLRTKLVDNVNNVTKMINTFYATNDSTNPLSLTSWKLYTRKQTLAIPGAGNEAEVLFTSTANTTYGAQIQELWAYYQTLPLMKRTKCVVMWGDKNIAHPMSVTDGVFTYTTISAAGDALQAVRLNLMNTYFSEIDIKTDGTYSTANFVSMQNTLTMKLVLI